MLQSAGVGRGTASNRLRAAREMVASEKMAWSGRVLRRRASIAGGGRGSAGDLGGRRRWRSAWVFGASTGCGGKACRAVKR